MRIPSFLDKALAIAFGSVMAAAILWSIFGTANTEHPKGAETAVLAKRHGDLVLMDAVRVVNADASLLMLSPYFSLAIDDQVSCLVAQRINDRPDLNSSAVAQVVADQTKECEFVRFARKLTLPVFERIASARVLPPELFAFEAFHADTWAKVGLFDQVATCISVQQEGLRQGIGTKACLLWTPRF